MRRLFFGLLIFYLPSLLWGQTPAGTAELPRLELVLPHLPADFEATDGRQPSASGRFSLKDIAGTVVAAGAVALLHGRGNTTWHQPKKPFNLTLDQPADLLETGKPGRKFCLLANFRDPTLLRTELAFGAARVLGLTPVPASRFVELYLNGDYRGLYQLTQRIAVGSDELLEFPPAESPQPKRTKAQPAPNLRPGYYLDYPQSGGARTVDLGARKFTAGLPDPVDLTGPYLLELDLRSRLFQAPAGFFSPARQAVTLKFPERVSSGQVAWLAQFYQEMEEALADDLEHPDRPPRSAAWLDWDSLARSWLLQELAANIDAGLTSFFLLKGSDLSGDRRLRAGPAWDFDVAFGNYAEAQPSRNPSRPDLPWVSQTRQLSFTYAPTSTPTLLAQLTRHPQFMARVARLWTPEVHRRLLALLEVTLPPASLERNRQRWQALASGDTGLLLAPTYAENRRRLDDWFRQRLAWLDQTLRP